MLILDQLIFTKHIGKGLCSVKLKDVGVALHFPHASLRQCSVQATALEMGRPETRVLSRSAQCAAFRFNGQHPERSGK